MSKPTNTFEPEYNAATAQRAFDALKPRMDAIPPERVASANIDLRIAATTALAVERFVNIPEVFQRFASLPRKEFDPVHIENLGPSAWALWYARTQYLSASAGTDARLPMSLVQHATDLKVRMLRVLEYHTDEAAELASIRAGTGYYDLATDLSRLAALYDKHKGTIQDDRRYYRAGDKKDATTTANRIIELLGEAFDGDAKTWARWQARAWTLLQEAYDEVRAAGLWLFRHEGGEEKFPSLFTISRHYGSRRKPEVQDEGEDEDKKDSEAESPKG